MSDEPKPGFTRRDLVRGALVSAVATGVGPRSGPTALSSIGPGAVSLELTVNGELHRLSVEPRVVLADALRETLGLTGTKVVCGRGACGACTVLVDGETVCSCLMLAHEARGKKITTVEGLVADGRLTPIQEAFIAADALQCGFCTSGMILSCKSLLDRKPRPTREEIRDAIAGNLCRCGTYPHVFEAVERAAGVQTSEDGRRYTAAEVTVASSRFPSTPSGLRSDERVDRALGDIRELEEGLT